MKWLECTKQIPWTYNYFESIIDNDNVHQYILNNFFPDYKNQLELKKDITSKSIGDSDYERTIIIQEEDLLINYKKINYFLSTMDVTNGEGLSEYSFWFVRSSKTTYYYIDGIKKRKIEFILTCDQFITFQNFIDEALQGELQVSCTHEKDYEQHIYMNDIIYTPSYKNSRGLSICDQFCSSKNNRYYSKNYKLILKTPLKTDKIVDSYIVYLSKVRGDIKDNLKFQNSNITSYYLNYIYDTTIRINNFNDTTYNYNLPYLILMLPKFAIDDDENISSKLSSFIDTVSRKDNSDFTIGLMLDNYNIEFIQRGKFATPRGIENDGYNVRIWYYLWNKIKQKADGNFIHQSIDIYCQGPDIIRKLNADGSYSFKNELTLREIKLLIDKKIFPVYIFDDLYNKFISPHLKTLNHYTAYINSANGTGVFFDFQNIFYDYEQYSKNVDEYYYSIANMDPLLSPEKIGYKITLNATNDNKINQLISNKLIFNLLFNYQYPYGTSEFNAWYRQNINSLMAQRENINIKYQTSTKTADQTLGGQSASWISSIGQGIAGGAAIGGPAGAVIGGAVGAVNALGNAISSGIQRDNAIKWAKAERQMALNSLDATIADAKNLEANINANGALNTFEDIMINGIIGTNYWNIFMIEEQVNETDYNNINYHRMRYGNRYKRFIEIKGLKDLIRNKYQTYWEILNFSYLIQKVSLDPEVKDTLTTIFTTGINLFSTQTSTPDNIIDFKKPNNYRNIEKHFRFPISFGKTAKFQGKS